VRLSGPNPLGDLLRVPIIGRIQAGEPMPVPASDFNYFNAEDSVDIAMTLMPAKEKSNKHLFALEVQGDSMIDAMINDGDIVIMKAAQDAKNGDMVAVWLPDGTKTP
jgi:repressor LexA